MQHKLLKVKKICFFCLLFIFLDICLADNIKIEIPSKLGIGQAFLLKVSSKDKIDKIIIKWDKKSIKPFIKEYNGYFEAMEILGIGLNNKLGKYPLSIKVTQDGKTQKINRFIDIIDVNYASEKISVKPSLVKPPKKLNERLKKERKAILNAINTRTIKQYWKLPFYRPVGGIMLSRFGLKRTFNKEIKRRHRGLDFRAREGTPIHSITNGKIVLSGEFYFCGNAIVIDHGTGLISLYCHMSQLFLKKGDYVVSGQKIGLAGSTGRVTAAHLHLSMYANGRVIDPEPFFNNTLDSYKQWQSEN
ncbi:MAG: M23 family metallopeptidase [Halarcobacter sp.]